MGFVHVRYDDQGNAVPGWPKVTVKLEHLEPSNEGPFAKVTWRMLDALGYEVPEGVAGEPRFHVAPAHPVGRSTDLASVPPWLWGVIASFGQHTLAALLHDHLCDEAKAAGPPASKELRREADRLFRVAMGDLGIPALRKWVMWAAVRLFGEAGQPGLIGKVPTATVLISTVVTWTAVGMAIAGRSGPAVWLLVTALALTVVTAVVAALARRNDVGAAVLVGAAGGPLVAPALLVSLLTVVVLDGPALLAWGIRKLASKPSRSPVEDPGPPPRVGPMQSA
jgi:hypothetical protein